MFSFIHLLFSISVTFQVRKDIASSDGSTLPEGEEITELSESWKPKSKFDPPKTDNQDLELFLDTMKKELLNPKKENRVQDNLKNTERKALYNLANYNKDIKSKNLIRTQDKRSTIIHKIFETNSSFRVK